ncbi:transglutaminaseTgpA domain-containing protein [Pyrinomonas sp.]|uniref:transglutaminaseTgpA domain-containing protein n=1 Tax=Pyrinomonas sp. TaxID=2080306 RepID=UPI0033198A5A
MAERAFQISSRLMVALGGAALLLSGAVDWRLGGAFFALFALSLFLEKRSWQISEKVGLILILLALPIFYLDWQRQWTAQATADERLAGVAALTHLLLFLSAIKLLQRKQDRDWVFLYLISFFEILLAAGLMTSPSFLVLLVGYVLVALMAAVCFEIRRAERNAQLDATTFLQRKRKSAAGRCGLSEWRLLAVVVALGFFIFGLGLPIFLLIPRMGSGAFAHAGEGVAGFVGFSEGIRLGEIGRLQQSNRIVMRVRIEGDDRMMRLRWRGAALDRFDGRSWARSSPRARLVPKGEHDLFQLGTIDSLHRLTTQTVFLEPIDTPVLFVAPRVVAVQGALPFVRLDAEGNLSTLPHPFERITYRVYSEIESDEPWGFGTERLGEIRYSIADARYLQLPSAIDPRIEQLAQDVIRQARAHTLYEAARAIENYLQTSYGYSLEMKASGEDPLADFLFRVREGHCEYFSSAMAIMLRTQGIAARVVNGFKMGEYNEAADVHIVRQRDAHSWVEVYSPAAGRWLSFDPTPFVPFQDGPPSDGLSAKLRKYAEALELFWLQYVVSYDRQEQRQLARAIGDELRAQQASFMSWADDALRRAQRGWQTGGEAAKRAATIIAVICLIAFVIYRTRNRWMAFWMKHRRARRTETVAFYERMVEILARGGWHRAPDQTPAEFAAATGLAEVAQVTEAYHRVRFGAQDLTTAEIVQIEACLRRLEDVARERLA